MGLKKKGLILLIAVTAVYLLLSIPAKDTPQTSGAGSASFAWDQDEMWESLEAGFREARTAGCDGAGPEIEKGLQLGRQHLALLAEKEFLPSDPLFDSVEANVFGLGPLVAACPEYSEAYTVLITTLRYEVKLLSRTWDISERPARDRLYRLLYGGRAALEEVMLQASEHSPSAVLPGKIEPSQTPSFQRGDVVLHSGDILISRGGAPTSALIARGNDYPGNFSHIALLYVDEATGTPSIIEAHIERGVVISSLEEYLKDVKLRVMAMRVRSDHPLLEKDPMIPHRAAKSSYEAVVKGHIPYDFAMNFHEPSKQFCSEVASHAYASYGVTIWNIITTMSSPGVVNWLGDFGVRYFETQAPADLEYDPQLVVVAEWRDMDALWNSHVDNAVIDAMLEAANHGERVSHDWYLLAPARLTKAYSSLLNRFGRVGPIPEGMSAVTALKSLWLGKMHKQTKERVLAGAAAFEQINGYRPPYWDLVSMATAAYGVPGDHDRI